MIESLRYLQENKNKKLEYLPKGNYHKSMPEDIEKKLLDNFEKYKDIFSCHK